MKQIFCAIALVTLVWMMPDEAWAAYSCMTKPDVDINGPAPLVVPIPEDEVETYTGKGFSLVECTVGGVTPDVARDRMCQLNAQLPPELGDKLAANFGASPAQLCASTTKSIGGTAQ